MRIFFDSEFTGLHQNTTLISIGFVSENKEEFYAEFVDYDKSQVDNWLKDNVIDNLIIEDKGWYQEGDTFFIKHEASFIADYLKEWLSKFDNVELWSDCLSYDWVLLSGLIANREEGYPKMPDNFVYHSPFDILTLFKITGQDYDISREKFAGLDSNELKHNALWDARIIKACYEKMMREFKGLTHA